MKRGPLSAILSLWILLAFYLYGAVFLKNRITYHSELVPVASVTVVLLIFAWLPLLIIRQNWWARALLSIGIVVLGYLLIVLATLSWAPIAVFEGQGGYDMVPIWLGLAPPTLFALVVGLPVVVCGIKNGRPESHGRATSPNDGPPS